MRDDSSEQTVPERLLAWYDIHARALPWRIGPAERAAGVVPDPYRVWMSEIMLQQTTVVTVKDYFHRFTERWPNVEALAAAEDADVMAEWAGLGYYARARNLLKCARVVAVDYAGVFPTAYDALIALPGIGPYTASAISAIAFDRPEAVMDGNVERVVARLCDEHTPLPEAKKKLYGLVETLTPAERPGDYAQAVMDLGATICTPKSPACGICPLREPCLARLRGTAPDLPRKTPKKPKPTRYGVAYIVQREDGALLLERRPSKGLLGGMLGWPGSEWNEAPAPNPPIQANWQALPGEVRHTFTHFHLILRIQYAMIGQYTEPEIGEFIPMTQFSPSDLPTLMRKVFDLWYKG
ncbi:MAG: A/G-specific adenine glycosylase [Arenibacterium sp.]